MFFFEIVNGSRHLLSRNSYSKLFIILKLASILLVLFTTPGFAYGHSPKKSLRLSNVSLVDAFSPIEKKTEYSFTYQNELLKSTKKVNVDFSDKGGEEYLKFSLTSQPFDYKLYQKFIVLNTEDGRNIDKSKPLLQETRQQFISGIVTDSLGNSISGVSIVNIVNKAAAATNGEGKFTISGKIGDYLMVSSVGFITKKILVANSEFLKVILLEESQMLDDIVVTALGIKRSERTLSYNVQKLGGDDLTTAKSSNLLNSLVGKVAGAQINTSASGPGGAVKVVLRGSKSISLNNNALYVIDGIPMNNFSSGGGDGQYTVQPGTESIADLNPDDIEEISVMTGPSAAALYGYEGANGVVLITTKKGRPNKTSLSFNHSTMISNPFILPKFQNSYGNVAGSVISWGSKTEENFEPSKFFQSGVNLNNSLSLSTGNEKSQNYLSVATNNAKGIVPNNKYNRYNFSYRNTTNFLDDRLLLDISASYIIQNNLNMVSQGQYFNPLPAVYLFPRSEDFSAVQLFERFDESTEVLRQFWNYGDQGLTLQNPYWTMYRMNREVDRKRYLLTTSLRYKFSEHISLVGRVNVDNMNYRATDNRYAGTIGILAGPKGRHGLQLREEQQLYTDMIATYNNKWDAFSLNVNVGGSLKDRKMENSLIEGDLQNITNYFSVENMDRSVGTFKIDSDGLKRQTQSVFANAELGYNNYLFLTLTGRNDWDSALALSQSKERSFFYPSIGLSAIISELVTLPTWFNYLKARGSVTQIGNSYDPYLTTEQYIYNPQTNTYALANTRPNYFLKPEITNSTELGIDVKFFNSSLNLSATYYKSNTKNQTHIIPESGTEYNAKTIQAGNVKNSGIELLVGFQKSWNNFDWNSSVTYSFNKNKIITLFGSELLANNPSLENVVNKATLGSIGSPIVRLTEGGSMGDIYSTSDFKRDNNGYIFLNPTNLLPTIENLSPDNYRKLGSMLPTSHVGWRNSFGYKDLRLNIAFSGRFGGLVVSNTQAILDRYGVSASSAALREKGGIKILENDISAQNYYNIIAEGTGKSDFYVYDADNIRLQEVSFEYKLKRSWLGNIANASVGIVGTNLLMIFNKAPFDPEAAPNATSTFYSGVDYFMQPSLRSFGFNIKLQF